jgi:hypothetical protein
MGTTALERVELALQADVTVAAQQMALRVGDFDPEKMTPADDVALVDVGTVIATGLKKLEEDRTEVNRGFNDLRDKTTAKLSQIIEALKAAKLAAQGIYQARQRVLRAKADEEARIAAKAAAEAAAAAVVTGVPAPPPADMAVEQPSNTTRGAIGQASGRRTLTVKMVDAALVLQHYPHLIEMVNSSALIEARAMLTRCKNDEAKMCAEMLKRGIEAWYAEGTPSFGARRK